jgi:hypothetical protein
MKNTKNNPNKMLRKYFLALPVEKRTSENIRFAKKMQVTPPYIRALRGGSKLIKPWMGKYLEILTDGFIKASDIPVVRTRKPTGNAKIYSKKYKQL